MLIGWIGCSSSLLSAGANSARATRLSPGQHRQCHRIQQDNAPDPNHAYSEEEKESPSKERVLRQRTGQARRRDPNQPDWENGPGGRRDARAKAAAAVNEFASSREEDIEDAEGNPNHQHPPLRMAEIDDFPCPTRRGMAQASRRRSVRHDDDYKRGILDSPATGSSRPGSILSPKSIGRAPSTFYTRAVIRTSADWADEYDAIETLPHWPPLPRIYYAHPSVGGARWKRPTRSLASSGSGDPPEDRELIRSQRSLTSFWGGSPGTHPLTSSPGRIRIQSKAAVS